jgi:hypothetical protein
MRKRRSARPSGSGESARPRAAPGGDVRPPPGPESPARPSRLRPSLRTPAILVTFAAAFVLLTGGALTGMSATWDEPIHLTAGHAALVQQDYRVDPSHPPAVRMWAALPTLFLGASPPDSGAIDRTPASAWLSRAYQFAHRFLYAQNDADRLLYPARFMVVSLGVVLGLLLFGWARAWLGFAPAVAALAFYTLEPNLLAHASLVTTDLGVTCFLFGAVYCAWRLHRGAGWGSAAGLALCASLAVVSKFSGLLVAPLIVMLLGVSMVRGALPLRRGLLVLVLVAATSWGSIWAIYGFRYLPSASPSWTYALHAAPAAGDAGWLAGMLAWADTHRLLPNAFTQGAIYTVTSLQQMPAFLNGEIRQDGWWYYFPAAFLLKTPVALLALVGAGLVVLVARRRSLEPDTALFLLLPVAVYLGVAMWSGVNLGVRHILPVYPFLILVAAAAVREAARMQPRAAVTVMAVALAAWGIELARTYPHTLAFFNQIAGGPANGHRYLSDSNLAWGQSLKGLKVWMDRNDVSHLNLAYFGQADPAYYGIDATYLPGGPSFAAGSTSRPRLPGYVAISATVLSGVYAQPWMRLFYQPFHALEPVAVIGHAMRVYRVDQWPAVLDDPAAPVDPDLHRQVGDALLFGFMWGDRAALHYEEYLQTNATDAAALTNYGIALIAANRTQDGLSALHRAVRADPNHGPARLTLARALIGAGDLAGAAAHAEHAARLRPGDPEAHQLLDRVRLLESQLRGVTHGVDDAVSRTEATE